MDTLLSNPLPVGRLRLMRTNQLSQDSQGPSQAGPSSHPFSYSFPRHSFENDASMAESEDGDLEENDATPILTTRHANYDQPSRATDTAPRSSHWNWYRPNGTANTSTTPRSILPSNMKGNGMYTETETESEVEPIARGRYAFTTSNALQDLKRLVNLSQHEREAHLYRNGRRRRSNSFDASEVDIKPEQKEQTVTKRRSLSDEEAEYATQTSRKTTSSKADAFLQLRDKLHNATQLMNITTPTFDALTSNESHDTSSIIRDIADKITQQAEPSTTPMHTFRLSTRSEQSNYLMESDSEMHKEVAHFESYDAGNSTTHLPYSLPTRKPTPSLHQLPETSRPHMETDNFNVYDTETEGDKSPKTITAVRITKKRSYDTRLHTSRAGSTLSRHDVDQPRTYIDDSDRDSKREWNGSQPRLLVRTSANDLERRVPGSEFSQNPSSIPARAPLSRGDGPISPGSDTSVDSSALRSDFHGEGGNNHHHVKIGTSMSRHSSKTNFEDTAERLRPNSQSNFAHLSPDYQSRSRRSSYSSSRPSSPASSHQNDLDDNHTVEHERERNWNPSRPRWSINSSETPSRSTSPIPPSISPSSPKLRNPVTTRARREDLEPPKPSSTPPKQNSTLPRMMPVTLASPVSPPMNYAAHAGSPSHAKVRPPSSNGTWSSTYPTRATSPVTRSDITASSTKHDRRKSTSGTAAILARSTTPESSPPRSATPKGGSNSSSRCGVESPTTRYGSNASLKTVISPGNDPEIDKTATITRESRTSVPWSERADSINSSRVATEVAIGASVHGDTYDAADGSLSQERTATNHPIPPPPTSPRESNTQLLSANSVQERATPEFTSQNPEVSIGILSPLASPPIATTSLARGKQLPSVLQTPPRQSNSSASIKFQTPPPPKGMTDLPVPPLNSEDSDGESPMQSTPVLRPHNESLRMDISSLKTPRPPGAWMMTPAPLLKTVETVPKDPAPSETDSVVVDNGLATPAPSYSKGSNLPTQTPAPPGAWMNTPAARKSILKVRFETNDNTSSDFSQVELLQEHSSNFLANSDHSKDSNEDGSFEMAYLKHLASKVNDDTTPVNSPPSKRPIDELKTPGSPNGNLSRSSIRMVNAYGKHHPNESSPKRSKAINASFARKSMKIVDAMGRELDAGLDISGKTTTVSVEMKPMKRKDALVRVRHGLSDLVQGLDDLDRTMGEDAADAKKFNELTEQAMKSRLSRERIKQELQSSDKRSKRMRLVTLNGEDQSLPMRVLVYIYLSLKPWLYLMVIFIQIFIAIVMYKWSLDRGRRLFLTTYFDPFNAELHLQLNPATQSSITITPWIYLPQLIWKEGWFAFLEQIWARMHPIINQGQAIIWNTVYNPPEGMNWPPT